MSFNGFKNLPDKTTPLEATFLNNLLDMLLPIGKTEIFYDNNDHSNYMGFTWERTSIGKVPVGIDSNDTDFNTIGKTGGEKTHTLTENELTWHNHQIPLKSVQVQSGTGVWVTNYEDDPNVANIWSFQNGSTQPHNIIQPYIVMAFWKRIA